MCLKRKGQALLEQMEIAHATLKGGTALKYPPQILQAVIDASSSFWGMSWWKFGVIVNVCASQSGEL